MIRKLLTTILIFTLFIPMVSCQVDNPGKNYFLTGADVFMRDNLKDLKNKRVGIVANQTSQLLNGTFLIDTLLSLQTNITAIFSPEHGFTGNIEAGKNTGDTFYTENIPVISLYGKNKKPTKEMLDNVDVLVYDLQDVGARFYTYISTLYYVIEAASENIIPLYILDRPDLQNGKVSGPVLENNFKSFTGIAQIPVIYGITPGELSLLFANEFININNPNSLLHIIKMDNWNRNIDFNTLGIKWVSPSPNITDYETALIYPATCFLEGTNISEGRGTLNPFLQIGAPFIKSNELIAELVKSGINGLELSPVTFKPKSINGISSNPKYKDEKCFGIKIKISDRINIDAVNFGVKLLYVLHKLYPEDFRFIPSHFDNLAGSDKLRIQLEQNLSPEEIINSWQEELNKFKSTRKKYLLY